MDTLSISYLRMESLENRLGGGSKLTYCFFANNIEKAA